MSSGQGSTVAAPTGAAAQFATWMETVLAWLQQQSFVHRVKTYSAREIPGSEAQIPTYRVLNDFLRVVYYGVGFLQPVDVYPVHRNQLRHLMGQLRDSWSKWPGRAEVERLGGRPAGSSSAQQAGVTWERRLRGSYGVSRVIPDGEGEDQALAGRRAIVGLGLDHVRVVIQESGRWWGFQVLPRLTDFDGLTVDSKLQKLKDSLCDTLTRAGLAVEREKTPDSPPLDDAASPAPPPAGDAPAPIPPAMAKPDLPPLTPNNERCYRFLVEHSDAVWEGGELVIDHPCARLMRQFSEHNRGNTGYVRLSTGGHLRRRPDGRFAIVVLPGYTAAKPKPVEEPTDEEDPAPPADGLGGSPDELGDDVAAGWGAGLARPVDTPGADPVGEPRGTTGSAAQQGSGPTVDGMAPAPEPEPSMNGRPAWWGDQRAFELVQQIERAAQELAGMGCEVEVTGGRVKLTGCFEQRR